MRYGMRYGIETTNGGKYWFFNIDAARNFAVQLVSRGRHGWIVSGELINDEGCTPYIERRERLEQF